jgi:hypothetical protein
VNVDTAQFAALRDRVDGHEIALRSARTLDELLQLMWDCVVAAGIDLAYQSRREGRRERHLYLVKGDRYRPHGMPVHAEGQRPSAAWPGSNGPPA